MNRPRTATALTHYNAVGQADWTQDAAGHRTTFFYDPCTGRCTAVSNAVGVELGDRRKVARKSLRSRWATIAGDAVVGVVEDVPVNGFESRMAHRCSLLPCCSRAPCPASA